MNKLDQFKNWMQEELDNNKIKGNWEYCTNLEYLICELEYHKAKLLISIKTQDKLKQKEYVADTANFLLMIANSLDLFSKL